ncbi:Xaa-Pro dipeptidase Metallo peptidase. MEROPS family M24B [Pseudidiomarina planktonica]|uniref:Xaa-Pro dipeptidase n=1 Tax=Pseudidiomarina planktonica TaxID=1323738 RepID=A0A1Y6FWU5_9GAMM|nr:Xaa-Pro dipeptidase [Pseudidiomarina planktonica]RUO63445.1 Xaa-Pro dipeptidase [Pseudidiomarina planktonica]SMQ80310.1 Xaa-Pro dipeptidase Metallo peptidase. MEROPS family M24B [Pseudidiomarina planktonica]
MSSYSDHIATVQARFDAALEATGFDSVLVYAGQPRVAFLDDNPAPYKVNPLFKYWLPVTQSPKSAVFYQPGQKPVVFLFQARDFWHAQAEIPTEEWQQHVELIVVDDVDKIAKHLGDKLHTTAFIGEDFAEPVASWPVQSRNPQPLLDHLHYHRAIKTTWEIENLRYANELATKAHNAARDAFFAGASELEIHHAYLAAINFRECEVPYNSIVALNEHGAILHYDIYDHKAPAEARSFLIDAGATYRGYCADITRTYTKQKGFFADLIEAVDAAQQDLLREIKPGVEYYQLHVSQHLKIAQVLSDFGFVKGTAEEIYDKGYTSAFFPHGLGHFIGLQVHDVGGHLRNDRGDSYPRDERHPFLRLLRPIEEGQVFTIEPGLYVVDQLLEDHADSRDINWDRVAELRPYGGVRIEDSIVVGANGNNENLTRDAFAKLG